MNNSKIILLSALLLSTACSGNQTKQEPVRSVKCDTVRPVDGFHVSSTFPGKVKAAADVNLSFRISGPIEKINVTEGQFVRKGSVIAEMDSRDYKTQLSATEAEYMRIKGEADRVIELYRRESVAPNEYEKALYGLKQITAKLEAHRNALTDTRLIAPFDCYIQKKNFDAGETVSAGMPVLSVISARMPEVEINIPTADFIKRGDYESAVCAIDVFPGTQFPLELIGINQKANLNQLYTTRFRMVATGPQQPAPGMTAMVSIKYKTEETQVLKIPFSAIFNRKGDTYVWVIDNDTVSARQIKIIEITTAGEAVVSEGLKDGETVVSAGTNSLEEGQRVMVLPAPSSTNPGGVL